MTAACQHHRRGPRYAPSRSAPPPSARGGERSSGRHANRTARCRHRLWRPGCAQPAPSPARPAPRFSLALPRGGGGEKGGLRLVDWPAAPAAHRGRHFVPLSRRGREIAAFAATPPLETRALIGRGRCHSSRRPAPLGAAGERLGGASQRAGRSSQRTAALPGGLRCEALFRPPVVPPAAPGGPLGGPSRPVSPPPNRPRPWAPPVA